MCGLTSAELGGWVAKGSEGQGQALGGLVSSREMSSAHGPDANGLATPGPVPPTWMNWATLSR